MARQADRGGGDGSNNNTNTSNNQQQQQQRQHQRPPPRSQPETALTQTQLFFHFFCVFAVTGGTFCAFYYPSIRSWFGEVKDGSLKWWQTSVIYQVYPRSFQDSDGDGVGDLRGIQSRLGYLHYLGVDAVWLSPIYKSPMADFGYDVADFTNIDPLFGTLEDFDNFINAAHSKGIHVIMDFVPNHSSDQHKWFLESRKGGATNPYSDYYVWSKGKRLLNGTYGPPNNWVNCFGGSMWTWDDSRKEYYMHQFTKEQPDLNFRHPAVQKEMLAVLQFWLDRGVDGFRADAVRHMFEVEDLSLDEPRSYKEGTTPEEYDYWSHPYTVNQPEIHAVVRSWRDLFDQHYANTGKEIFLVLEIWGNAPEQAPYYHSGANFPFNFNLQQLNRSCDGLCVRSLVDEWTSNVPEGKWSNWVLGSHDVSRISHKMGDNMVRSLNMVLLLLPGTPTTYYGEEIGMKAVTLTYQQTQDPFGLNFGPDRYHEFSRDPERSPMQWNSKKNAGFSSGSKTWLPIHPEYQTLNVEAQARDPSGESTLQLYKKLVQLRKQQTFSSGGFDLALVNKNIFSFYRYSKVDHHPAYLIAVNVGNEISRDNYRGAPGDFPPKSVFLPYRGYVVYNTGVGISTALTPTSVVQFEDITLHPGEGVVIRFWPDQV